MIPGWASLATGAWLSHCRRASYSARLYSPAEGGYTGQRLALADGETGIDLKPFSHDIVVHIEAGG